MNFHNLASTFLNLAEKGLGSRIPGSHFFRLCESEAPISCHPTSHSAKSQLNCKWSFFRNWRTRGNWFRIKMFVGLKLVYIYDQWCTFQFPNLYIFHSWSGNLKWQITSICFIWIICSNRKGVIVRFLWFQLCVLIKFENYIPQRICLQSYISMKVSFRQLK